MSSYSKSLLGAGLIAAASLQGCWGTANESSKDNNADKKVRIVVRKHRGPHLRHSDPFFNNDPFFDNHHMMQSPFDAIFDGPFDDIFGGMSPLLDRMNEMMPADFDMDKRQLQELPDFLFHGVMPLFWQFPEKKKKHQSPNNPKDPRIVNIVDANKVGDGKKVAKTSKWMTGKTVAKACVGLVVAGLFSYIGYTMLTNRNAVHFPKSATSGDVVMTKKVTMGDVLNVYLPGNPTTGYTWSQVSVPAELELGETKYAKDKLDFVMGAGGKWQFPFRATKVGSGQVKFRYSRAFEKKGGNVVTLNFEVVEKK